MIAPGVLNTIFTDTACEFRALDHSQLLKTSRTTGTGAATAAAAR